MKNHYDILGVKRTATSEEIKTAYRKLSIKFHPDKNDGEAFFSDMFRQVNEAYNILYDTQKRSLYDKQFYKFEHPERPGDSFKKASAPASTNYRPNTEPVSYSYTKPKSSVWDGVNFWKRVRNYMLLINLVLIIILAVTKSSSEQSSLPINNSVTNSQQIVKPKHKHRSKKLKGTPLVQDTINQIDTSFNKPANSETPNRDTVYSEVIVPQKSMTEVTRNITAQDTPKKRGFFKRLFGKKN